MLISLIFVGLLLAVAFFQSTQGLFSALIMAVLTITCAALAYGTYEWVAVDFLVKYWKPDLAHAISLVALFGVPLVILRVIFDKAVRRSCMLPVMIDRIGGAVCGLVTALIMVGVAVTALQMIPFGNSMLGFSRFDVALRESSGGSLTTPPALNAPQRGFWLSPDRFAVGTAAVLSDGIFSGNRSFYQDHPDLIQAAAWVNTIHDGVSRYAPPRSVSVQSSSPVEVVYCLIPAVGDNGVAEYEPINPKAGFEFRMVRVGLTSAAHDANRSHLFSLRQFRLVGEEDGRIRQYHPIATQQEDATQTINRHVSVKRHGSQDWPVVDELISPRQDNSSEVELVFELVPGFKPDFIEYKRAARAKVSFAESAAQRRPQESNTVASSPSTPPAEPAATPAPSNRPAPPEVPSATTADAGNSRDSRRSTRRSRRRRTDGGQAGSRGGNVRGFTSIAGRSFFGDQLPFELKRYRGLKNTEVSAGALIGGHLVAVAKEQEGGSDPPVSKLRVPEEKRLLHLNVGKLEARSMLGRALSQAVAVAQNYTVTDANGAPYKTIGKYSLADVNGEKVFELQYFPDQAGTMGGLGKFDRIDEKKLKRNDDIVLLFLVDPGAEIVRFNTGGSASRADDLRSQNLKAPD